MSISLILHISSIYELFEDIPAEIRLQGELNIPEADSEPLLMKKMIQLSTKNKNANHYPTFLGAGTYDHYIPNVVDHMLLRSEFYTAYTPYQPEISQGEWTGLMMVKAYHAQKGETRTKVFVPDSAHGTNPASATVAGFETITIPSNENGLVNLEELKKHVGNDTAALMLTNPNTLGLFEKEILEIAEVVHEAGGLLYYDGANANAILGKTTPGSMGFDIVHLNLHKTFTGPHGGGGPVNI